MCVRVFGLLSMVCEEAIKPSWAIKTTAQLGDSQPNNCFDLCPTDTQHDFSLKFDSMSKSSNRKYSLFWAGPGFATTAAVETDN